MLSVDKSWHQFCAKDIKCEPWSQATYVILNFLVATFKVGKTNEINLVIYLSPQIQIIIIQHVINTFEVMNEVIHIFFPIPSFLSQAYL